MDSDYKAEHGNSVRRGGFSKLSLKNAFSATVKSVPTQMETDTNLCSR